MTNGTIVGPRPDTSSLTRRRAGQRPTLSFSPGNLLTFRPVRGKVYAGSPVPKIAGGGGALTAISAAKTAPVSSVPDAVNAVVASRFRRI